MLPYPDGLSPASHRAELLLRVTEGVEALEGIEHRIRELVAAAEAEAWPPAGGRPLAAELRRKTAHGLGKLEDLETQILAVRRELTGDVA